MDEAFAELGKQLDRVIDSFQRAAEAARAVQAAWEDHNTKLGEDQ